jgi:hypothetical protein
MLNDLYRFTTSSGARSAVLVTSSSLPSKAHLARIIKVDFKSELFTYNIEERALSHARLMDSCAVFFARPR